MPAPAAQAPRQLCLPSHLPANGKPHFDYPSREPAQTEIASIAAEVGRRVRKMLQRRGLLRAEPDDAEPEAQSAMDACMQVHRIRPHPHGLVNDRCMSLPIG